jgi:hypothetical protein
MKIKTDQLLTNLKGIPLKSGDITLTVGLALTEILLALRGEYVFDKVKSYFLAKRINDAAKKEVDVDGEDCEKLIKTVETSEVFGPIVVGQLVEILRKK